MLNPTINEEQGPTNIGLLKDDPAFNQVQYHSKNPDVSQPLSGPIRLPVRPQKKDKAIKQNDLKYSPAFGEANISDLFIAFKNLSSSYSMLGNVYKMPKGVSYT